MIQMGQVPTPSDQYGILDQDTMRQGYKIKVEAMDQGPKVIVLPQGGSQPSGCGGSMDVNELILHLIPILWWW